MGVFRKVEAEKAGPQALGILIPPGRRTFVILRPRGLGWDLLLCRDDLTFRELAHDEASAAAQAIYRALGQAEAEVLPGEAGWRVRVTIGPFALVACARVPGRPYAALHCGEAEAREIAARMLRAVSPPEGAEQEVYFNVRFFERPPSGAL